MINKFINPSIFAYIRHAYFINRLRNYCFMLKIQHINYEVNITVNNIV